VGFRDVEGLNRTANVSIETDVYLSNGGRSCRRMPCAPPTSLHGMSMNGWINSVTLPDKTIVDSPNGYLNIVLKNWRRFDTDPMNVPLSVKIQSRPLHDVRFEFYQNPDLHADPPNFGTVLYDAYPAMTVAYKNGVPTAQQTTLQFQQPYSLAGDKFLVRFADASPAASSNITSVTAAVLSWKLGKAN
jgi:hypothetical protein